MFTENMIQYSKTGNIGVCSKCKNNLNIEKIETPTRDNYIVSCKKCKKKEYFTGVTK